MLITAVALMAIGSLGIGAAVVMEMKTHEPIYALMMKIMPLFFGVGAVILALAIARGG